MGAVIGHALVATIVAHVATASLAEASCVPGFDYAAFGKDSLNFGGGSSTDSFDSSLGPYAAPSPPASGGNIATNGTACSSADINGTVTTLAACSF